MSQVHHKQQYLYPIVRRGILHYNCHNTIFSYMIFNMKGSITKVLSSNISPRIEYCEIDCVIMNSAK